jgi:hypothetical protein
VVAFIVSLLITGAMIATLILVARRRPVGQPLTWGEAFVAATFVFALLFVAYGVVPHQWLAWADGELAWRKDFLGVPVGPLTFIGNLDGGDAHTVLEDGISFGGRGQVLITKEAVRDIIASLIYVVFLVMHALGWLWWQRRGARAAQKPELETSAYGRPLVRPTT